MVILTYLGYSNRRYLLKTSITCITNNKYLPILLSIPRSARHSLRSQTSQSQIQKNNVILEMERSAEHISHVIIDIDNTKSLQSIPKNQATDNPILQVYIKLISVGSRIICRYLYQQLPQVTRLKDHIFFGPESIQDSFIMAKVKKSKV